MIYAEYLRLIYRVTLTNTCLTAEPLSTFEKSYHIAIYKIILKATDKCCQ